MNSKPKEVFSKRYIFVDSRSIKLKDPEKPFEYQIAFEANYTEVYEDVVDDDGNIVKKLVRNDVTNDSVIPTGDFKNVVSAELKSFCFPKVKHQPFVTMSISEFNDQFDSNDNGSHRSAAILYFDTQIVGEQRVNYDNRWNFKFEPPIASLSKLNIKFLKHGGQSITKEDVGVNDNDETKHNIDHSYLFEITTVTGRYF